MLENNNKENGEPIQCGNKLESDTEKELDIPKRKARRSSVFRRRSSLFVSGLTNKFDESGTCIPPESNDSEPKEIRQIKEYIEELEKEKKDWKNVFQELKIKYRILNNKQAKKIKVLDQESRSQYFTDEDNRFIAKQPNYRNVCKLLDQTLESQVITMQSINQFKETVNKVTDIRTEKLEKKKSDYIKRLEDKYLDFEFDFGYISDTDLC